MAPPYIGRIQAILRDDGNISAQEFAALEEIVFASDGIIDGDEVTLLAPLFSTAYHFEAPEDGLRFKILVQSSSLEGYVAKLQGRSLKPSNSPASLSAISRAQLEDTPILIDAVTVDRSGKFVVMVGDRACLYHLTLTPELISDQHKLALALAPFSLIEFYSALSDMLLTKASKKNLSAAHSLQLLLGRAEIIRHRESLQKSTPGTDSQFMDEVVEPEPIAFSAAPKLNQGLTAQLGVTVYGEVKDPEIIKLAFDALPPRVMELYRQHDGKFYFSDFSQRLRNFFVHNPDADGFHATIGGYTTIDSSDKPYIDIDRSHTPKQLIFVIIHEVGHALMDMLDGMVGGKGLLGYRQTSSLPNKMAHDKFTQLVDYHYEQAKQQRAFLESYGASRAVEWFAQMFAFYTLGKYSQDEVTSGVGDYWSGTSLPWPELLNDFKQTDPVGYLMMSRLDHELRKPGGKPETVFSWSVYQSAQLFAKNTGQVITEQAEVKWREQSISFEAETDYQTVDKSSVVAVGAYLEKWPTYFPALRDLLISWIKQVLSGGESQQVDFAMIMRFISFAFRADSTYRHFILEMIQQDISGLPVDKREVVFSRMIEILQALIAVNLADPALTLALAEWLMKKAEWLRKKYDYSGAVSTLLQAAALSAHIPYADAMKIQKLLAVCYIKTYQYERAEAAYFKAGMNFDTNRYEFFKLYYMGNNNAKAYNLIRNLGNGADLSAFLNHLLTLTRNDIKFVQADPRWPSLRELIRNKLDEFSELNSGKNLNPLKLSPHERRMNRRNIKILSDKFLK